MADKGIETGHGRQPRGQEYGAQQTTDCGRFGKMFPDLPPLEVDDDRLRRLAVALVDDGNNTDDNPKIPAGFTYLGQFVDHDITFDPSDLSEKVADPGALLNFRTPRLDLDCVYGGGSAASPHL